PGRLRRARYRPPRVGASSPPRSREHRPLRERRRSRAQHGEDPWRHARHRPVRATPEAEYIAPRSCDSCLPPLPAGVQWEDLAGICPGIGIEDPPYRAHRFERCRAEGPWHVIHLVRSYSVLAGDTSAGVETDPHDLPAGFLDLRSESRLAPVEADARMQITVARVEDVTDPNAQPIANARDSVQDIGQGGAGNHRILNREVRRQPSQRAERLLPPLPQPSPVGGARCAPHVSRSVFTQQALDD